MNALFNPRIHCDATVPDILDFPKAIVAQPDAGLADKLMPAAAAVSRPATACPDLLRVSGYPLRHWHREAAVTFGQR